MDYEKILKEALNNKSLPFEVTSWIEEQFPQLAESEGEKIRRELIDFVKSRGGFKGDWIAWLEKQGEQKLYVNDNAKEMFIKALERVEEQNNKGYKLTDCDKNSWWEDFKAYTSCIIEQKPAVWSEEDKNTLEEVISILEYQKWRCSGKWHCVGEACPASKCIDKLKSLRPQSKWKPSDEQMNALNYVVNLMASSERPTENDLYYNILKSLRQQLKKLKE